MLSRLYNLSSSLHREMVQVFFFFCLKTYRTLFQRVGKEQPD